MSRFDDDLRRAAAHLAREPLPPEVLDEALDAPPRQSVLAPLAWVAGAAAIVLVGAVAIGQLLPAAVDPSPSVSPSEAPSQPAIATCEDLRPPAGGADIVIVHFPCGTDWSTGVRSAGTGLPAVERLEIALLAVLGGPSELEGGVGMRPVVPEGSGDLLAGVTLADDGLAEIDFTPALRDVPNLSTTAAGGAFVTALRETAFEFAEVTALELRIEGDCQAFFEHFESNCHHIARPIQPMGDCPIIPPAQLPSGAPTTEPRPYAGEVMVSWGSGTDTVTQRLGHRDGGPELPSDGQPAAVRGFPATIARVDGRLQLGWVEDGCTYLVWLRTESIEDAVGYAGRFGPVVAQPSPPPPEPVTASVEKLGIRLTVTLDRGRTVFGQRVTATTTVTNIGSDSVFWGHSSTCAFPTGLEIQAGDAANLDYGRDDWRGENEILKRVTVGWHSTNQDPGWYFMPEAWLDFAGTMGCTSDYVLSEIVPGELLTHVVEWDAQGEHGAPPPPGTYPIVATFAFESRGEPPGFEDEPEPQVVSLQMTLVIEGPALDYISPGVAFDALLEHDGYQGLLADAPRRMWVSSDIQLEGSRWVAALFLDPEDDASPPTEAIVGEVDARTGEVLRVAREPRTHPNDG